MEDFVKAEAEGFDASKWADVENSKQARASIGIAFDTAWSQARKEIEFIRGKSEVICGD